MPQLSVLLGPVVAAFLMAAVSPSEHVAVVESGPADGRPAVLVPGLSGCAYGFAKLEPLLQDQGLRTIAIEPLGTGLSDRVKDADYTLTAQAQRLAAVLDLRRATAAVVVCQGVSAGIVFRLALARPDLVAGILSIEGGPAESAATGTVRNSLKLAKIVAKLGGSSYLRDRFEEDLRKASGDPAWVDKRTVRNYFRGPSRDLQGTLDAFIAMTEQPEPVVLVPRLGEIKAPVTVLLGGAEHASSLDPGEVALLRAGLPDVTVVTVEGAGHFIHEEQPAAVAEAVAGLLVRIGGAQE